MTQIKKGIRVLIGIPLIMLGRILFTVGMQLINIFSPIILFVAYMFMGRFTLSAEKFVTFISLVITAPFAIILAIISAPFVAVMLSIDTFWKQSKGFNDFRG